jgi:hypothetical protein
MNDQFYFNRLNEGQSVQRPPFGDVALVYDADGVFKVVSGDTGAKTPFVASSISTTNEDIEITSAAKGIILRDSNGVRRRLRIDTDGTPLTEVLP